MKRRASDMLVCGAGTRGFTLVEVLVTLVVFSMLSVAGLSVLNQSITAKGQADRINEHVEQLRRTHALLKSDLAQLVQRPTRDRFGGRDPLIFVGGKTLETQSVLRLVRDGWDNPLGLERRSSLQKVEYHLQDGNLIRRAYLQLDSSANDQFIDLVLLSGVDAADLSFLVRGQWYDAWSVKANGMGVFPSVVAINFRTTELGEVRQVFLTSGINS